MNQGTWFGRLTRSVNVQMGQNGAKQAFFTLACDKRNHRRIEQLNQQDGGHRPTADFIPCSIFGYGANNGRPANNKRVDAIAQGVHKGDLFGVSGPINTWSKKNPDGSYTDNWSVRIRDFQFCNSSRNNRNSNGGVAHGQKTTVKNPFANPNSSTQGSTAPSAPQKPKAPQSSASQAPQKPAQPQTSGNSKLMNGSSKKSISDDDLPF